ncbi:MAG: hypothetical protein LBQ15_02615 [Clostridium sp.]|jgi:hypothetical protein|nr:hypothetical protein [Clostridium sp.]
MDFFEKIGTALVSKGKEAAETAKKLAGIAHLRSRIATCEEVVKKNYLEIGKAYYEAHGEAPEAFVEKQCRAIRDAEAAIEELREKIREKKGL